MQLDIIIAEIPVSAVDFCEYSLNTVPYSCRPRTCLFFLYWSRESRKIRICPNPTVSYSDIVLPGVYITFILTILILRDKTTTWSDLASKSCAGTREKNSTTDDEAVRITGSDSRRQHRPTGTPRGTCGQTRRRGYLGIYPEARERKAPLR